jgi:hypothetical protein
MAGRDLFNLEDCYMSANGVLGRCLSFNGSSSFIYGDVPITPEMTFAVWVYFTGNGPYHIIDCRNSSGGIQPMYGGPSYGIQAFNSANGGYTWDNSVCGFTTATWYHIAVVYEYDKCSLYINGVFKGSTTAVSGTTHGTKTIGIGTRYTGENWFKGKMNGVRIYNHALTQFEISQISKPLMLHYSFEDLYKPVEFITLTGGQYFDTGIVIRPPGDTSMQYNVVADIKPYDSTGVNLCICGCGDALWNGPIMMNLCNNKTEFGVGGYQVKNSYTVNRRVMFRMKTYSGASAKYEFYKNETLFQSETKTIPNTSNTLTIGGFNYGTINPDATFKGNIYGFHIQAAGVGYKEYIPAVRRLDGVAGLYEIHSGEFLTNKGTGVVTASSMFGYYNSSNANIKNDTITFSKSSQGWGNCGFNSRDGYERAYVSARPNQTSSYIMIGLSPNNTSYDYIYGWFMYPRADGTFDIYENNVYIANYGGYNAGDEFKVTYDGHNIRYYRNDSLVRTTPKSGRMYMNINCYSTSGSVSGVRYGWLEDVLDSIEIPDDSGNMCTATLQTPSAYSVTSTTNRGLTALRNVSHNPAALIKTKLYPEYIRSGTIAFWYKKDATAFNYNSGNFLVATQHTSGSFFGATDVGRPFCSSDCSYQKFYLDGVETTTGSNVQDTDWHFYVFTGVYLVPWRTFAMHAHGDSSWLYTGNISDFKVYNSSLTQEDIDILYKEKAAIAQGVMALENNKDDDTYSYYLDNKGVVTANLAIRDIIPLEYITVGGNSYIDTGVLQAQNNDGVRVKAKVKCDVANGAYICGSHALAAPYKRNGACFHPDGSWEIGYGDIFPHVGRWNLNATYELDWATFMDEAYLKVKGGDYPDWTTLWSGSGQYITGIRLYAFSNQYSENAGDGYCFNGKCYYLKIYNEIGYLIRDYIPAIRKMDGAVGLYDKQNHVFYIPTKGTFGAGPKASVSTDVDDDVELLNEYITAQGNSCGNSSTGMINTQLIFNPNTDTIVVDFQATNTAQNAMMVANSTNDANHIWMYYYNAGTKNIDVYVSTGGQDGASTIPVDDGPHTLIWDGPRKQVRLDGALYGQFSRNYSPGTTPLVLFGSDTNGGYNFKGLIFSCKIYRNGRLIRDYRPGYTGVVRGGMYDKVHGGIYTSFNSRLYNTDIFYKRKSDLRSIYGKAAYKHMGVGGLTYR